MSAALVDDPEEVGWAFQPDAEMWRKAGFRTWGDVQPWIAAGVTPKAAAAWRSRGFTEAESAPWATEKIAAADAASWRALGFTAEQAAEWDRYGLGPEQAKAWRDTFQFNAVDAGWWTANGFTLGEAQQWIAAGVESSDQAQALLDNHIHPPDLEGLEAPKDGFAADDVIELLSTLGRI